MKTDKGRDNRGLLGIPPVKKTDYFPLGNKLILSLQAYKP
jgi:hypothetical protein